MNEGLYHQIGPENIRILVDNFYDLVFKNERISRLFLTDKEVIKEKQRLFLTQFLGGPDLYSQQYGHPRMRARHLPHDIHEEDAQEWLSCMAQALKAVPIEESVKDELVKKLVPTAFFMVNKS